MINFWNRKEIFFSKTQELGSADVNFFFQAYRLIVVSAGSLPVFGINLVPDGKHFPRWVKQFLVLKPTGFIVENSCGEV